VRRGPLAHLSRVEQFLRIEAPHQLAPRFGACAGLRTCAVRCSRAFRNLMVRFPVPQPGMVFALAFKSLE
jgi:hypothetical protein